MSCLRFTQKIPNQLITELLQNLNLMKITVQSLVASFKRDYELKSPGITFGRSTDNLIALPDPSGSLSLFQGVIKFNNSQQITIRNLATTPITLGDKILKAGQSAELHADTEFSCGNFKFTLSRAALGVETDDTQPTTAVATDSTQRPHAKTPTVLPMPNAEKLNTSTGPMSIAEAGREMMPDQDVLNTTQDKDKATTSIFDDLFGGSHVTPIGIDSTFEDTHPFEMNSAISRNTSNPLEQLTGIELDSSLSKDPLERLSQDGLEQQQRDIFADSRPSTLLHDESEDLTTGIHNADLEAIFKDLERYTKNKS